MSLTVEVHPDGGVPTSRIDEVRVALRELGLDEEIEVHGPGKEEESAEGRR